MKTLFAPIVALMLLAGCANGIDPSKPIPPHVETVAKLGVQVATLKVVRDPDRAAKAVRIATNLQNAVDGGVIVALDELEKEFFQHVDISALEPTDQLLVRALVTAIKEEMKRLLAQKVGTPDDKILIDPINRQRIVKVLGWVREAALLRTTLVEGA